MDVITRNFFRLIRSGSLDEQEPMEPMSAFKWQRLFQMVQTQHVERTALKGIARHQGDEMMNIPQGLSDILTSSTHEPSKPQLSNRFLNYRLRRIIHNEYHAIDTNIEAVELLKIIVNNVSSMLNKGIMLGGLIELGSYLRTKGDKVDFVKLERWLRKLHIRRMAQLQGSMLMAVFQFEQDELPFMEHVEASAYKLVMRSVLHTVSDTVEEWHFRQGKAGFLQNNSSLLRRNLRRGLCYVVYAPLETVSNFFHNFARSLQEIEE